MKCAQLDEKLQHFRRIASRIDDRLTDEALDSLAKQFDAQKLAVHPRTEE